MEIKYVDNGLVVMEEVLRSLCKALEIPYEGDYPVDPEQFEGATMDGLEFVRPLLDDEARLIKAHHAVGKAVTEKMVTLSDDGETIPVELRWCSGHAEFSANMLWRCVEARVGDEVHKGYTLHVRILDDGNLGLYREKDAPGFGGGGGLEALFAALGKGGGPFGPGED